MGVSGVNSAAVLEFTAGLVSGKSQPSIALLAMENVQVPVLNDGRCWVSFQGNWGRVRGWFMRGFQSLLELLALGLLSPPFWLSSPNSKIVIPVL